MTHRVHREDNRGCGHLWPATWALRGALSSEAVAMRLSAWTMPPAST